MRFLLLAFVLLAASAARPAAFAHEEGIARPGGAYLSVAAQSAAACAEHCARDALCMSWTLAARQCELKAVVPAPVFAEAAVSGLSPRAPDFARLAIPAPEPRMAELLLAPPLEAARITLAAAPLVPPAEDLLGGPDESAALRRRMPTETR